MRYGILFAVFIACIAGIIFTYESGVIRNKFKYWVLLAAKSFCLAIAVICILVVSVYVIGS